MEYEQIKKLMEDMGNSKLTEVELEFADGTKLSMKKDTSNVAQIIPTTVSNTVVEKITHTEQNEQIEETNIVKSPMVGTFYSRPAPDKVAFVHIGSKVKKGDVLCIIEAMKLMNEIESEYDGEIVEILVKENEIVDYGKPLFRLKK